MDWREIIIKRKQMRDKSRQKPQTRMAGGSPDDAKRMRMGRKDSLDNVFEGRNGRFSRNDKSRLI